LPHPAQHGYAAVHANRSNRRKTYRVQLVIRSALFISISSAQYHKLFAGVHTALAQCSANASAGNTPDIAPHPENSCKRTAFAVMLKNMRSILGKRKKVVAELMSTKRQADRYRSIKASKKFKSGPVKISPFFLTFCGQLSS
jgi:hypothetical protein